MGLHYFSPSSLSLSHVQMSLQNGHCYWSRSLINCHRVRAVELRPQGEAFIKFANINTEQATCRLTQYTLTVIDVEKLTWILEQCPHLSELELNDNKLSQMGVLCLVNTVMTCEKVVSVEVSLGTEERSRICFKEQSDPRKTLR
ncbi:hypothetical protein DPEC_G00157120 [Dallia pectoralis]|uniref:Uncharacterized protein n=1 Tax=Dallia pectoralis TaxID=75939 RepID=A0ACC2GL78_DALPE|nr:hypothetical protein DPEC_G00157120 [Dallia pectoralis]